MRLAYSLNRCLEHVTGNYIARMDGDDISSPDRLERQLLFLQEHQEYDLVGTAMRRFNEDGMADIVSKPMNVDKYTLRRDVPFNHATILTHRYVYDRLNGYVAVERTKRCEDYDLWFRFFHADFSGYNLQEALYYVREDINAIKRRTFSSRRDAFRTTKIGFRLLGFPRRWLVAPFFTMLFKSVVPYKLIALYRSYHKKKHR